MTNFIFLAIVHRDDLFLLWIEQSDQIWLFLQKIITFRNLPFIHDYMVQTIIFKSHYAVKRSNPEIEYCLVSALEWIVYCRDASLVTEAAGDSCFHHLQRWETGLQMLAKQKFHQSCFEQAPISLPVLWIEFLGILNRAHFLVSLANVSPFLCPQLQTKRQRYSLWRLTQQHRCWSAGR